MNIYVGNLSFSTTEEGLRGLFEQSGQVDTVTIIRDRVTGRSRGFGFVEMPNDSDAHAAIEALDGNDFDGRNLKVNQAKERADRGPRGGGGRRGGGGYGGGGGRRGGGGYGGGGGYNSDRSGGDEGNAVSSAEDVEDTKKAGDSGFGSGLDDD